MAGLKPVDVLAEVEGALQSAPPPNTVHSADQANLAWLGRAQAALYAWDPIRSITAASEIAKIQSGAGRDAWQGYMGLVTLLHVAQSDLRMKTVGPITQAIGVGQVFQYFEGVRKLLATAVSDLFVIDRYLDASFVADYLPQVSAAVSVRLLARDNVASLVPAARNFAAQNGTQIAIRSSQSFHDRYIFIDSRQCFQSGASFKDGGRGAPTTVTEISDAFAAIQSTYEAMWQAAAVQL